MPDSTSIDDTVERDLVREPVGGDVSGHAVPPGEACGEVLTRDALANGVLLAALREQAPPEVKFLEPEALEASLDHSLRDHDPASDVYLFGYGSLMWNPAFHYANAAPAAVRGWHRRFCLSSTVGRGTPQQPGLMLGLDRGGACRGMVFRISAAVARDELRLVWRREMSTGVYEARWLPARLSQGTVKALTFVVNRTHPRYLGQLTMADTVRFVRSGQGRLGTCAAYVESLLAQLSAMSVKDAAMERLRQALLAAPGGIVAG